LSVEKSEGERLQPGEKRRPATATAVTPRTGEAYHARETTTTKVTKDDTKTTKNAPRDLRVGLRDLRDCGLI
jgi:hypothetical protein